MGRQYPKNKPQNTGEKRKDQGNIIVITITIIIMTVTMTMIMTEIVDLETGIDHTIEIDHLLETDCKTTVKMITEITIKMIIGMIIEMVTEIIIKMITKMTIKMTIEMTVEKKVIGISKNRYIRESIEVIMKTHMKTGTTGIIIEIVTKMKIEIRTKINPEMTVMTKLEVGLKKKIAHMMIEKMKVLRQNLKGCKQFCKQ